jgi:hypothetical protein
VSCKISALLSGLACLNFLAVQKQNFDNSMVFKWGSRRWKGDCTNLHAFAIVRESGVRSTKRCGSVAVLFAAVFFLALAPARAPAQEIVVGVNVVNPMRASVANQNTLLSQLKAAEVRVIRCGIPNDDKGIDFAKRAAAQGIRIQLIVGPQYAANAPSRPYQPDVFPAMWGGHPLSFADPELSTTDFQKLFDGLDANGITLAGVELGNEINWAAFNPEFPCPAKERFSASRTLPTILRASRSRRAFYSTLRFWRSSKRSVTTRT